MKLVHYLISVTTILFVIVSAILYLHSTVAHEDAHKQFAIYNSCNKYEISYFLNPHFECLNRTKNLTREEIISEDILDSLNEIVSYNMTTTWMAILLSCFIICVIIILVYLDFKAQFIK